jgi:glycine oxidase
VRSDFQIIGGGVIGLLMARELASAGATVTIVERGTCCSEASWAGGGIVSPLYPWRYSAPVTALASVAQSAYPALAAELLSETGIDPELETTGLLMLDAMDAAEALAWAASAGKQMQALDAAAIHRHDPGLGKHFEHGLWMPDIANIRNPRLGQALLASLRSQPGVEILEHAELLRIDWMQSGGKRQVRALKVSQGGVLHTLPAGQVIVAAGAWSGRLLASADVALPVVPVKGQMLLYATPTRLLRSIILSQGRYLIPRRDNLVLVGSTLEHDGFDKSLSADARGSLRDSAIDMLPALANIPVKQQWAGLRPGAPGGIPSIGQLPSWSNLYVNAGHFRNGLVLAPASARLLADILLGRPLSVDPEPYQPALARLTVRANV